MRHNARPFIFTASITPASCAAALAALRKLEAHPELVSRLAALSTYARAGYKARGIRIRESIADVPTPIVPLYTNDMVNTLSTAKRLYDAGVYVNPVLPPAVPEADCLLRTSYMATHTEALLDEAMDIIAKVMGESK